MESVLRGHPENNIPFCVKSWRLLDLSTVDEVILYEDSDNHLAHREVVLPQKVTTDALGLEILETHGESENVYGGVFEIRAYED
jgi:hypothetical protein